MATHFPSANKGKPPVFLEPTLGFRLWNGIGRVFNFKTHKCISRPAFHAQLWQSVDDQTLVWVPQAVTLTTEPLAGSTKSLKEATFL